MEEKNKMIKEYILLISKQINSKYPELITEDKILKATNMFIDSKESYEEIIKKINTLANDTIEKYLKFLQDKEKFNINNNKDNRNSRTFKELKNALKKVQKILENSKIKIYIAGGSVPYLLLNQDSNRLHDDIDTICHLEDISKLREIFKKEGLYISEWDSITYAKDKKDYGFEMKIDGVPFGIFPFTYQDGEILQYSYDPYNKQCKIKTIPLKQLSDYIMCYKSIDGTTYDTMSLEYIKITKDNAKRNKDIIDSKKINETNLLRQDVLNRIKMYQEIQKIEADKLPSNSKKL